MTKDEIEDLYKGNRRAVYLYTGRAGLLETQYDEGWNDCIDYLASRGLIGSVPEWQDISTAPKDGTFVKLYWKDMSISMYPAVGFNHGDEYGWEIVSNLDYGQAFPTHWMPLDNLPTAPTAKVGE